MFEFSAANRRTDRLPLIDVARGAAVVAMIAYHFSWDLWSFALIDADLLEDPLWLAARTAIVSAFLFIAGVCAMHERVGHERAGNGRAGTSPALLRRFAVLTAAAAAVSLATWFIFPDSWIFFGVLHHMAVAGLLAAALRRIAPVWLLAALAVLFVALGATQSFDALNAPWLRWVGMGSAEPNSNDYVPLLPWFGAVLAGMAAGPWALALAARCSTLQTPIWKILAWLGRYSLIIYLAHQPLLYGGVWAYAAFAERRDVGHNLGTRAEMDFMQSCAASCVKSGGAALMCETNCLCARDGLRQADLWRPLLTNALSPSETAAVERIARSCATAQ